jgi:hypothetical protein
MAAPTTAADQDRFIEFLEETANVSEACKRAKIARALAYKWRGEDEAFAARWEAAVDRGTDALEDEAVRRAHVGYDKPVYQGGKAVGTIREYSDTLLMFMLKARRPERFKDRSETAVTGKGGGPVASVQLVTSDPVEAAREYQRLISGA